MSTIKVNAIQNTSGVEVYTAKAWVNFNGSGTVAIRASGNVSSITDNGVGIYTINFTNNMVDENYAIAVCGKRALSNEPLLGGQSTTAPTVSSCRILVGQAAFTFLDGDIINFAAFR